MKTKSIVLLASIISVALSMLGQVADLEPVQFLPGDTAIAAAYGNQQSSSISRGGNIFLVVWADTRALRSGSDIYAQRLDATGNLLDVVPFVVSHAPGDQVTPRAVWNGSNWLVVWRSQEPTEFYWASQVMAARVSTQGAVLDPTPIGVTSYQNSQSVQFTAASDGTNWLVVAEGAFGGESAVLGFRVSPDGINLDPAGVVIVPETYYQRYGLEAAFAGDEYLFLWTEWNAKGLDDVSALRLNPALESRDASPIVVASSTDYDVQPRAATDGTNFFVTYERYNTCCGEGGRVFGTRINHQGVVQDPAGLDISGNVGVTVGRRPSAAWDGANWMVAWCIPSISVARVSPSGAVLDPGGIAIDGASTAFKEEPDIAPAPGGGARVVWTDYRAGSSSPKDIFSAAVSVAGQPAAGVPISVGAPSQLAPRVAASANGYLAVFLSATSSGQRVLAQRLDAAGNPRDLAPVELAPTSPNIYSPSVAANSSGYLVVWEDRATTNIYGKRVHANGTVLDATPLAIMRGKSTDVASLGDTFLVVSSHAPGNPQYRFIYSRRVRASDAALLDAAPVLIGGSFSVLPRVAALGGRWLAVWQSHPTHDDPTANIYGAFVDASGSPTPELAVTQDGYYVRFHYRPAIAANSANALVLWSDPRFGNSDWGIFGRRVLADGTILDAAGPPPAPRPPIIMPSTYPGFALTTAPKNQDQAAVVWDGREYITAWEDQRATTFFLDQTTDIFGARVASDASVLDPDGFSVTKTDFPDITPAVAGMNGYTVTATSMFNDQSPFASFRIGLRNLSVPAVVAPTLRISFDGPNVTLIWPTNATGFALQSAATIGPSASWAAVSQSPEVKGTDFIVSIPVSSGSRLFRLCRP